MEGEQKRERTDEKGKVWKWNKDFGLGDSKRVRGIDIQGNSSILLVYIKNLAATAIVKKRQGSYFK